MIEAGTPSVLGHLLWPEPFGVMVLAAAVSFAAGAVRGISGFGYSALVVAALSAFVPIGPVVVAVLMMEVVASAGRIREALPQVDRRWHRAVLAANLVFVPVGVLAIAFIDPSVVRVSVSFLLLLGAAVLRMTMGRHVSPTGWLRGIAGVASGFLNGFAASGGLVVALTMAATGVPPATLRATMISVLLWISLYGVLCSGALALSDSRSPFGFAAFGWALCLWPTMLIGIRLGETTVVGMNIEGQRRWALNLLIVVAISSLSASVVRATT